MLNLIILISYDRDLLNTLNWLSNLYINNTNPGWTWTSPALQQLANLHNKKLQWWAALAHWHNCNSEPQGQAHENQDPAQIKWLRYDVALLCKSYQITLALTWFFAVSYKILWICVVMMYVHLKLQWICMCVAGSVSGNGMGPGHWLFPVYAKLVPSPFSVLAQTVSICLLSSTSYEDLPNGTLARTCVLYNGHRQEGWS